MNKIARLLLHGGDITIRADTINKCVGLAVYNKQYNVSYRQAIPFVDLQAMQTHYQDDTILHVLDTMIDETNKPQTFFTKSPTP